MVFCGSGWIGTVSFAGMVFGWTKSVVWVEGGARFGRPRGITTASMSSSSLDAPSVCATLGLGGCRRFGMVLGGPFGVGLSASDGKYSQLSSRLRCKTLFFLPSPLSGLIS